MTRGEFRAEMAQFKREFMDELAAIRREFSGFRAQLKRKLPEVFDEADDADALEGHHTDKRQRVTL